MYEFISESIIKNTETGVTFPNSPGGEEYKNFKKWEAENGHISYDPTPTDDEKIAAYRAAVGAHIDGGARKLGFDSIVTAVTYADEPADPLNQSYGRALRAWRSQCWEKCREVLATWQGGGAEPTVEELIASLPVFVAP